MSDKKLELIIQMLAKAESTTPAEAEALTEHAERLMVKYGIDQAKLEARASKQGQPSEQIVQEHIEFTGAYRGEMINLGAAVCNGLGSLRVLQSTTWNKGKTFVLYVIGYKSDVEQAIRLINSLQVQAAVAVRSWWKINKPLHSSESTYDQEKTRRSFVHGFGSGAGARIRDTRAEVIQESGKGTEIVLASRDLAVQAHLDAMRTRKGRARTATGRDNAAVQGYRAGQQANTGGTAVGS